MSKGFSVYKWWHSSRLLSYIKANAIRAIKNLKMHVESAVKLLMANRTSNKWMLINDPIQAWAIVVWHAKQRHANLEGSKLWTKVDSQRKTYLQKSKQINAQFLKLKTNGCRWKWIFYTKWKFYFGWNFVCLFPSK